MSLIATCRELILADDLARAESLLTGRLISEPNDADASKLLGIVLGMTHRFEGSLKCLEVSLRRNPADLETIKWKAEGLRALQRYAEAIATLEVHTVLLENDPEAINLTGICNLAVGRGREAEGFFRRLIAMDPHSAPSQSNLGLALRIQDRGDEALGCYRKALELAPKEVSNILQLARQLQQNSEPVEAIVVLEAGRKSHPDDLALLESLAAMLARSQREKEAEEIYTQIAPTHPVAANSYAGWLQERGQFEKAAKTLSQSLQISPLQGVPYRLLVEMKRFDLDGEPIFDRMKNLESSGKLSIKESMHLDYATGGYLHHEGRFQEATNAYDRANETAYRTYPRCMGFDSNWVNKEPDLIESIYSKQFFEHYRNLGSDEDLPIFIVGMIRSGTSLLDQMVSAHPRVQSVGEPNFWNTHSDRLHAQWSKAEPNPKVIEELAERYRQSTRPQDRSMMRVDKMPVNYRNLGPIHISLPRARIIHIKRDPFDTCVSIYSTFFGGGPSFAYNQDNILTFYKAYQRYMSIWRQVLPPDILLEIDYESLTLRPEETAREVISFLGLDWNKACLHPEANQGQIVTPSKWQARQPIFTTSSKKREQYEAFMPKFAGLL